MSQRTPVHMRIGKGGITDTLIAEISLQLKNTDPVVIKFLQSFRQEHDRKQAAEEIAQKVGCRIQKLVGGVLTLTKKH